MATQYKVRLKGGRYIVERTGDDGLPIEVSSHTTEQQARGHAQRLAETDAWIAAANTKLNPKGRP